VLNPNYNPYDLLEELAMEVQRLNDRQIQLERFLKDLSVQHANIAKHISTQSNELTYVGYARLMKVNLLLNFVMAVQ
jgi:hypothetical protein